MIGKINIVRKIRTLFRGKKLDAEMTEEMRHHVELQTELNVKAGMNPDEARYAALRTFGNVAAIREQSRERRGWMWLEQLAQDLRYAGRQLRRAPGFAAAVILTFALGIGATTAIISIVYSVVLQPLAFPDSQQLVVIRETSPSDGQSDVVSWAAYYRWEQAASFQSIGAARFGVGNLVGAGEPERATTLEVTWDYFATLGVRPLLGRGFLKVEPTPGGSEAMLLSHLFWMNKFGGDKNVVGRPVQFNGRSFEIAGVLPPNEQLDNGAGVFVLTTATAAERTNLSAEDGPEVVARLKAGVTAVQAEKELSTIAAAMAAEFPATNRGHGVRVTPLTEDIVEHSNYGMFGTKSLLSIFMGAVGLLLFIACTNVANLLLARASSRGKEIAMRAALGATRGRIVRQLLGESMLLFVLGGTLGLLFGRWGLAALKPLTGYLPRAGEITLNGSALGYSLAIVLVCSLGFGLVPALHVSASSLIDVTKRGARGERGSRTRRLSTTLVMAEVVLAMVLLSGAGLLAKSFGRLKHVSLGYRQEGVLANRLELPAEKYGTAQQQVSLVEELTERMAGLPEVDAVAFSTGMPIFGSSGASFRIAGRGNDPKANGLGGLYAAITPNYFKAVGITLLQGRVFSNGDSAGAPRVVIISEALAKRSFPRQNPIGQQLAPNNGADTWRTIVGVVADVKQWGPASDVIRPDPGQIYEPYAQNPTARNLLLVVHSTESTGNLPMALRSIIQSVDPDMPLTRLFRLSDGVRYSTARYRFSTLIGTLFAGLALLLATIGVYGVASSALTERTREIGVRMALGAQYTDILKLIFSQTGKSVGMAVVVGLGGALAGGKFLNSFLFDVDARDPMALGLVTMILLTVISFAIWLPVRRAAKVDPVSALRAE